MNDTVKLLVNLSDDDIRNRLTSGEDSFNERKPFGQHHDWVSTMVSFANSTPVGVPCILFIGVKDDGTIDDLQTGRTLEQMQQQFKDKMKVVYPPIPFTQKIVEKDGKQFVVVIVPGSETKPHFSGHAYVRRGAHTEEASEEKYKEFVARRSGKVNKLLDHKNRDVSVTFVQMNGSPRNYGKPSVYTIDECNEFWVTLVNRGDSSRRSVMLETVDLTYDDANHRLYLYIRELFP